MLNQDSETAAKTAGRRTRRQGGRAANLRGQGAVISQLPWQIPVNSDQPTEPLPPEGIEAIHDTAMRILEEIGVEFLGASVRNVIHKVYVIAATISGVGGVVGASEISISVDTGEVIGVIGANGAGKTTFVNLVTGYLRPSSSSIHYMGKDVTALIPIPEKSWPIRRCVSMSWARTAKTGALARALFCGTKLLLLDEPF